MRARRAALTVGSAILLAVTLVQSGFAGADEPPDTSVAIADCGEGSSQETGLQGQVPLADRQSGRSQQGYHCNLELEGQYQGQGSAIVSASYEHCQYLGTIISGQHRAKNPGVNVIDLSDPANPQLAGSLVSAATVGSTWESLKVNEERGLLAAVSGGILTGGLFVSVYDVKTDCAKPKLLNGVGGTPITLPMTVPGHEGGWSPDGRTYWTTSSVGGMIAAIDMTNPARPRVVSVGNTGLSNHGFGVSADGNRIYVANTATAGISVFDSSDIQRRALFPRLRRIADLTWTDGQITQHAIPFSDDGKPYLAVPDEFGSGGVKIIDISNERSPVIVRTLKLEINRPEHVDIRAADTARNGAFGYESHYCSIDRAVDPTALACGWVQSGVRVFDIRDLQAPREIAYFNPPAQVGKANELVSAHASTPLSTPISDFFNGRTGTDGFNLEPPDMTADWCMSPPHFAGGDRLWVACDDNGALALRFTNGAYPLS